MSTLLEEAIARVRALPPDEQDFYARLILAELEDGLEWDRKFAASQELLERMGREALDEHRRGETRDLDELLEVKDDASVS